MSGAPKSRSIWFDTAMTTGMSVFSFGGEVRIASVVDAKEDLNHGHIGRVDAEVKLPAEHLPELITALSEIAA